MLRIAVEFLEGADLEVYPMRLASLHQLHLNYQAIAVRGENRKVLSASALWRQECAASNGARPRGRCKSWQERGWKHQLSFARRNANPEVENNETSAASMAASNHAKPRRFACFPAENDMAVDKEIAAKRIGTFANCVVFSVLRTFGAKRYARLSEPDPNLSVSPGKPDVQHEA